MIGARVLTDISPENMEKIQKRESWPVTLLAPLLASKSTLYRLVDAGVLVCDPSYRVMHIRASSIAEAKKEAEYGWLD